jgi:hypothetical protein
VPVGCAREESEGARRAEAGERDAEEGAKRVFRRRSRRRDKRAHGGAGQRVVVRPDPELPASIVAGGPPVVHSERGHVGYQVSWPRPPLQLAIVSKREGM